MERKGQGREREPKIKGTLASGSIILSHQLDWVPQNKDQEHRQTARSWQQKKKIAPPPPYSYTRKYLKARVNLLAPNASISGSDYSHRFTFSQRC